MTTSTIPIDTRIATDLRDSSENSTHERRKISTLTDLLDILRENPPRAFPMLRTTCSLLSAYLDTPSEQVLLDSISEARNGFRPYLEGRKYAENSIRTFVNHLRILLKLATELGWKPNPLAPKEWRAILTLAAERKCEDPAKHLARTIPTPRDVSIEDVDQWVQLKVQQGISFDHARHQKTLFWRLLRDCGCNEQTPMCIVREKRYGVPLKQFPSAMKNEVLGLLQWKQVAFAIGRPKGGQHRAVTSKRLKEIICALYGFALNVRGELGISSLPQLVHRDIISGYVEWCINIRRMKIYGLKSTLYLVLAAMEKHPSYTTIDFTWFKPLLDSLPIESQSELKKRKASKCLDYDVVDAIPAKIHAERPAAAKKGLKQCAQIVQQELLVKWLITLPWRQRNLRQCRIGGPEPNLFKGKIPPFCDIDKPEWVQQEEQKNPDAKFWQFRFNCDETKTGIDVHAILPRPLIGPLEEYLDEFRPRLIQGADPRTLMINHSGKGLTQNQVTEMISTLTLRYGGRRVTPHLFRDIVSFRWLKEHAKDFLTLSKILWHQDVNTTIRTYGARFNESCGASAMDSWLEERAAKPK
jgi:hypothetical protein